MQLCPWLFGLADFELDFSLCGKFYLQPAYTQKVLIAQGAKHQTTQLWGQNENPSFKNMLPVNYQQA